MSGNSKQRGIMPNGTRRHHYLPQFYLRKFTSRGERRLLWEYDKRKGSVTRSSPKESGFSPNHHSITRTGGKIDGETIEARIKRDFEDPMAPVYETLRHRALLKEKEWTAFCLFAASMMVRVPNYIANTKAVLTKLLQRGFDIMKYHDEEFRRRCSEKGVPLEVIEAARVSSATRDAALTFSLAAFDVPAKIFARMYWLFLHSAPTELFATSDNPVFYCDPQHRPSGFLNGVGLANATIEVTFPLSRNICALGTWHPSSVLHSNVQSEIVDLVNERTIGAALRFVYSPRKSDRLLELVKARKNSSPKIICS
jgi:Protein of unknown function (DUF4238)